MCKTFFSNGIPTVPILGRMKKVRIGVELRRIKWKAAQLGSTGARPKSEK